MPELAGFEARYDLLPAVRPLQPPAEAIRPLYWWAKDLQAGGDLLVDARFDAVTMTATVSIRLASYQVVSVVRRHDDKPQMPRTLSEVDLSAILGNHILAAGMVAFSFFVILAMLLIERRGERGRQ